MNDRNPHPSAAGYLYTYNLVVVFLLATGFYMSAMDAVYAADTPMGSVLCTVIEWMTTDIGKGLATLGVCVIGVGAALGKASWGMALTVGVGIAVMFHAAEIIDDLGIGAASC